LHTYRAPRWLPGGNLQTIWGARLSRRHPGRMPVYLRERWTTPDGDFIDVDHIPVPEGSSTARHLVLFHGLEGSSASAYALAFAAIAQQRGWTFSVPHFRGCSGQLNRAPRAYHSGDFEEVGWILQRLRGQASGHCSWSAFAWAETPSCAGRGERQQRRGSQPPRVRRQLAARHGAAGRPSTRASTGSSTRRCSCAR
jgi:hypothetical protein